ncbi:uncharacterized protein UV8b_04749 [Ustilaginoidea virens]|uniref:Uncharacterized protein n=1 Tax=Ustilaginoidea virens TaxID=1159556 RepID=A0A8E5MHG5_USTVR|nr:uncharacterized protein UV8b_04749 [Ustilaginoidea virens]QUC20508.1 hypothetical protein UV8b_04749 [Ustilaginoidea virens]
MQIPSTRPRCLRRAPNENAPFRLEILQVFGNKAMRILYCVSLPSAINSIMKPLFCVDNLAQGGLGYIRHLSYKITRLSDARSSFRQANSALFSHCT